MFNIGEKVVCVGNDNKYTKTQLIIGQKYIVHRNYYGTIKIDNSNNFYDNENFITLFEYRKKKVKQLRNV